MEVFVNLEQVFQRVPCNSVTTVNDARFQYFEKVQRLYSLFLYFSKYAATISNLNLTLTPQNYFR